MRNVGKNTCSPCCSVPAFFDIWNPVLREAALRNFYELVETGHSINVVKPSNPICAKRCLLLKCPNTSKSRLKWFVLNVCYASTGPISFVWPCALTFDFLETSFYTVFFYAWQANLDWSGKESFSSSDKFLTRRGEKTRSQRVPALLCLLKELCAWIKKKLAKRNMNWWTQSVLNGCVIKETLQKMFLKS